VPDVILTDPQSLATLQDALIIANIAGSARHIYIPQELVSVKQEVSELNKLVVEELKELEGVDDVYHNMEPESVDK
jgi:transcriptional/translational regulatory protein YebC/TACO1